MKKYLIIIILLFIAIIFYLLQKNHTRPLITKSLIINHHQLIVEVADTESLRSQGLSGRISLPHNTGMLFIFTGSGFYQFWMKEMIFPLDFIWINNDKVVDLTENVPPPESDNGSFPIFTARYPFDRVIEVNAGTVKSLNIAIGNEIH